MRRNQPAPKNDGQFFRPADAVAHEDVVEHLAAPTGVCHHPLWEQTRKKNVPKFLLIRNWDLLRLGDFFFPNAEILENFIGFYETRAQVLTVPLGTTARLLNSLCEAYMLGDAKTNEWSLLKDQFDALVHDETVSEGSIEMLFDDQIRRRFCEYITDALTRNSKVDARV
jgi:hypothetical protein